ncbi:MAG: hypothetical protein WAV38_34100, partial [Xanthobacteraceae bacterium]
MDPDTQRDAFDEISKQIIDCLSEALKHKDDPWRAIRVIVKGEAIVSDYVNHRFDYLQPFQRQLQ